MWEDERAPVWRRRLPWYRATARALAALAVTAFVFLWVTNSLWLLLLAAGLSWASLAFFGKAWTMEGRLARPARKATERERRRRAGAKRYRPGD